MSRFTREGLAALEPRHAGGPPLTYTAVERERIVGEARRAPDRKQDGTATWSLGTLQRSLRRAPDGLPKVSTYTIWHVLQEAGPYQAIPQPGSHWSPEGELVRYPHEYIRGGTAKLLTLVHLATGEVRVKGVESAINAVLHPWLKEQLEQILTALRAPAAELSPEEIRVQWERWQEGLTIRFTLPHELPPLRMLLIWDNLSGHKSAEILYVAG